MTDSKAATEGFRLIEFTAEGSVAAPDSPPENDGEGKFVQIKNLETDKEYLVLAPRSLCTYHANIVELFSLLKGGLGGRYNRKRDHYFIDSAAWVVLGGGYWRREAAKRILELSGSSMAYGRYQSQGLKEKIEKVKRYEGYDVAVK